MLCLGESTLLNIAYLGATPEAIQETEAKLNAVAAQEIKGRSKIGKNRQPLLGFKPGDLLTFHGTVVQLFYHLILGSLSRKS